MRGQRQRRRADLLLVGTEDALLLVGALGDVEQLLRAPPLAVVDRAAAGSADEKDRTEILGVVESHGLACE